MLVHGITASSALVSLFTLITPFLKMFTLPSNLSFFNEFSMVCPSSEMPETHHVTGVLCPFKQDGH